MMGDAFGEGNTNEVPVHEVFVSAFYIDKCEVQKALWRSVRTWGFRHGYVIVGGYYNETEPDYPVRALTWFEAVRWCNARSEMEGRIPAYYTDAATSTVYRTEEEIERD